MRVMVISACAVSVLAVMTFGSGVMIWSMGSLPFRPTATQRLRRSRSVTRPIRLSSCMTMTDETFLLLIIAAVSRIVMPESTVIGFLANQAADRHHHCGDRGVVRFLHRRHRGLQPFFDGGREMLAE